MMAVIQLRKGWEPKIWVSDRALKNLWVQFWAPQKQNSKNQSKSQNRFRPPPPGLSFPRDKQVANKTQEEMSSISGSQGNTDQDTSSRPAGVVMSDNNEG